MEFCGGTLQNILFTWLNHTMDSLSLQSWGRALNQMRIGMMM